MILQSIIDSGDADDNSRKPLSKYIVTLKDTFLTIGRKRISSFAIITLHNGNWNIKPDKLSYSSFQMKDHELLYIS